MPTESATGLPDRVRGKLPQHGQEIDLEAFDSAFDEYADRGGEREQTAHRLGTESAVKKKYRKDEASGHWMAADRGCLRALQGRSCLP